MSNDDDDPKLTPADIQAIIDASEYLRDLVDRLEDAYVRKCDWKETMHVLNELFRIEKASVH